MKILALLPGRIAGGAEAFARETLPAVREAAPGLEIAVLGDGLFAENPARAELEAAGIPIKNFPWPRLKPFRPVDFLGAILRLRAAVRRESPQKIWSNGNRAHLVALATGCLARIFFGKFPEIWLHHHDEKFPATPLKLAKILGVRVRQIFVSEWLAADFARRGARLPDFEILGNGVGARIFDIGAARENAPPGEIFDPESPAARDRKSFREKLKIPAGAPVVGLLGRVVRWKGGADFLSAGEKIWASDGEKSGGEIFEKNQNSPSFRATGGSRETSPEISENPGGRAGAENFGQKSPGEIFEKNPKTPVILSGAKDLPKNFQKDPSPPAAAQDDEKNSPAPIFVLAGPAPAADFPDETEFFTKMRAAAKKFPGKFLVPGPVDPAEFFAGIDAAVHASREPEPFGRTVVEALAAGVPVVAAGAGGAAEILGNGKFGATFRPGDPADLAEKIREILADPPAAREKSARDRARAEDFRLEKIAQKLGEILAGG